MNEFITDSLAEIYPSANAVALRATKISTTNPPSSGGRRADAGE